MRTSTIAFLAAAALAAPVGAAAQELPPIVIRSPPRDARPQPPAGLSPMAAIAASQLPAEAERPAPRRAWRRTAAPVAAPLPLPLPPPPPPGEEAQDAAPDEAAEAPPVLTFEHMAEDAWVSTGGWIPRSAPSASAPALPPLARGTRVAVLGRVAGTRWVAVSVGGAPAFLDLPWNPPQAPASGSGTADLCPLPSAG